MLFCYITYDMLCYVIKHMLCYITYVMLYNNIEYFKAQPNIFI